MKKLTLFSICLVGLFAQTNYGQLYVICTSFRQVTNEGDYFKYDFFAASQPCDRDSFKISQINDTCFQVDMYYTIGQAASPCSITDSVLIADAPVVPYTLLITFFNYDYGITECLNSLISDIEDNFNNKVCTIFPNPSFGSITVSGSQIGSEIAIYNMLGQKVLVTKATLPEETIDITDLDSGTYFLSAKNYFTGKYSNILLIKQ
jgi:hypothetical protein